ncbi:MMPL family transporter [Hyphococcus formosus]|uniref:MMPL family transporter n=1 Tax=Hyphococcus formosus TaxID=3143534 RepID=UPI00398AE5BC
MLKVIEKSLAAWAETARRMGVVLAALIVVAACFAGYYAATHLKVNTDTSAMLDPDLPFQQRAAELREAFPQLKDDVIVVINAPTLDEADAFATDLRSRLLEREEDFTAVFAPAQEPFFRENGLLYLDQAELEARLTQMSKASGLIETLIKSPTIGTLFTTLAENDALAERSDLGKETLEQLYAELAEVVEASANQEQRPFSWMGALDAGQREGETYTRLVYATPALDYTRLQPAKAAINVLRAETLALGENYGGRVDTFITGDPALRLEELEAVTTGIGLSMLLSLILVSLLLLLCYRSIAMAALTLIGLVITLVFTSAFAAAFVGELNLVSVAFTVLLVGLGLDFSIHLLLHIQEHRAAGRENQSSLRRTIHEVGPALALAGPTTAIAFLSFVPTKFDGIAQLGIIAGAGVIIAFLVTVTFAPAALALFKGQPKRKPTGNIRSIFDAISKISGPVALVTIALGFFALFLMPQVRFDADQMALRNPNSQSVQGFNLLFENPETVPYRLSSLTSTQAEAEAMAKEITKLETVDAVRLLPDFVPDEQDEKLELIDFGAGTLVFALDAEPGSVAGPDAASGIETLRQRLDAAYSEGSGARLSAALADLNGREELLEANVFAFWPQLITQLRTQMNADYIDIDTLPTALRERYLSEGGKWRIDILPKNDVRDFRALDEFVKDVEAVVPELAGGAFQARKAGETISAAMMQATGIAFAVISVFLWLLVRKISTVILMLFPLALAAVLTSATGVLLNIPFNYANVIVLPLLIGIGVDSSIHLVLRNQQVKAGEGVYGTSTPRAVFFSALTTVASFGSLMLSPHRGTASMGELLSIAIAFTLVCTLIVLPAAFQLEERQTNRRLARAAE